MGVVAVCKSGVSIMVLELKSLLVQETEALNPFPQLKKALPEAPGNARMGGTATTSLTS